MVNWYNTILCAKMAEVSRYYVAISSKPFLSLKSIISKEKQGKTPKL